MEPNFLIIGAGKSGTTKIWSLLQGHPDVCLASKKEPAFFTLIKSRFEGAAITNPASCGNYWRGWEWYEDLYKHYKGESAIGEASTIYMNVDDAPELIHKNLPNIKLVAVLRHPVDRLYSHYWQERNNGHRLPSFEYLVRNRTPDFVRFCNASRYKDRLRRYFELFDDKQICIQLYDDIEDNIGVVMAELCDFLGVSNCSWSDEQASRRENVARLPLFNWPERVIWSLKHSNIAFLLPARVRVIGANVIRVIDSLNTKRVGYPKMQAEIRRKLLLEFEEDIRFVEQVTGRQLHCWRM